jgi:hypothetical protein
MVCWWLTAPVNNTDMSEDVKFCLTFENNVTQEIIIFHNFCARVSQTAIVSRMVYVPELYVICKVLDAGSSK